MLHIISLTFLARDGGMEGVNRAPGAICGDNRTGGCVLGGGEDAGEAVSIGEIVKRLIRSIVSRASKATGREREHNHNGLTGDEASYEQGEVEGAHVRFPPSHLAQVRCPG